MRKSLLGLAVLAALSSCPALAAGQDAPPQTESARIAALEARITTLESELQQLRDARTAPTAAAPAAETAGVAAADDFEALAAEPESGAPGAPPAGDLAADSSLALAAPADTGGASNAANAFNPSISIILGGSLSNDDGFSLGESEVSFAANIDDKFFGQLTVAVEDENGEDHVGVEEAFIDTTSLPNGLALRAGRFFSNIGYLNSHHAHTDSFFDRPLAYQAFLGEQYGDDGVQLRWVAPTSTFLELGGEVFRGEPGADGDVRRGGLDARTLFAHAGGSVGSDNEWLAGASLLDTSDGTLYVADGTWKWAPRGNFKDGGITLRSEYLRDDDDHSGAYLEGVYRLNRTWDVGYRYDKLWGEGAGFAAAFPDLRHSAEVTWRNSEFSLLRLQLSHARPQPDTTDNTVTLQYQTSLGAHGAHKF
jgi:hypothetical protein